MSSDVRAVWIERASSPVEDVVMVEKDRKCEKNWTCPFGEGRRQHVLSITLDKGYSCWL